MYGLSTKKKTLCTSLTKKKKNFLISLSIFASLSSIFDHERLLDGGGGHFAKISDKNPQKPLFLLSLDVRI